MDITHYLEQQWRQHGDSPKSVVGSLESGLELLSVEPAHEEKFRDYARLIEHTLLGHVGDIAAFDAWVARLEALSVTGDAAPAIKARLRFARDLVLERGPLPGVLPDDVLFPAASNAALGLSHNGRQEAALAILQRVIAELRGANKAKAKVIANATNSITFHLQQGPRHEMSGDLMVGAAVASREAWEKAGTWKEVERGEYFISMACAQAGRPEHALQHAQRCRDICLANGSDPYELFFAGEVLAKAYVALGDRRRAESEAEQMATYLAELTVPQQLKYCESKLTETRTSIERLSAGPS